MKKEDKLAALLFGLCIDETENLIETFKENIVPHNRKKTEFEIILLMSSIILEFTKQHIPLFDSFKKSYYKNIYYSFFERNDNWFKTEEDEIYFIEFRLNFYYDEIFLKMLSYYDNKDKGIPVLNNLPYTIFEYPLTLDVKSSSNFELVDILQLTLQITINDKLVLILDDIINGYDQLEVEIGDEIFLKFQNIGFKDLLIISMSYKAVLLRTNTELTFEDIRAAKKNTNDFLELTGIDKSNYDNTLVGMIVTKKLINNFKKERGKLPESPFDDSKILTNLSSILLTVSEEAVYNKLNEAFNFIVDM